MINKITWNKLTIEQQRLVLQRPTSNKSKSFDEQLLNIINNVKLIGDQAICQYTATFDRVKLNNYKVTTQEINGAQQQLTKEDAAAIRFAFKQIYKFHSIVHQPQQLHTITRGVTCIRHAKPIDSVGLYVPGGMTPLPSTMLMLGVPSLIAGCNRRIVCTPPKLDGSVDPSILFAAQLCGIDQIYKIGGAQAIAALAYGTQTLPKVQKIYGPGNAWVTAAKIAVMQDPQGASCDLPAGPSELMIIADQTANPIFIAADLLAQAEHAFDAQVFLITTCSILADKVIQNIAAQLQNLSRDNVITQSLRTGKIIIVDNLETAFDISNCYAPEHLSLQINKPKNWVKLINNAGAVFLGGWTAQTLGDYVIGTNHVLPTEGYSKVFSGLCVNDFLKVINIQQITKRGCKKISPYAITLAKLEQLDAHANAVEQRWRALS